MEITVVIPAHNEEKFISRCLASIDNQHLPDGMTLSKIVVLNRCTDNTAHIAKRLGASLIEDGSKNLSKIKNKGIAAVKTEWVITIDADSWMSPGVLSEIQRNAQLPNCLGGGIKIKPERSSLGIAVGYSMMLIPAFFMGLSFGMYWFRKADFDAVGGFDEKRFIAEDVDLLRRLKTYWSKSGKRHKIISNAHIITSCRKFDKYGDWHFVRIFSNPCKVKRAIKGQEQGYIDKNWYEVKR